MPDSFRKHYNINIIMTEIVVNMVYMYILYMIENRFTIFIPNFHLPVQSTFLRKKEVT